MNEHMRSFVAEVRSMGIDLGSDEDIVESLTKVPVAYKNGRELIKASQVYIDQATEMIQQNHFAGALAMVLCELDMSPKQMVELAPRIAVIVCMVMAEMEQE